MGKVESYWGYLGECGKRSFIIDSSFNGAVIDDFMIFTKTNTDKKDKSEEGVWEK